MRAILNRILPIGTRRRRITRKLLVVAGVVKDKYQQDYRHYIEYHEPYVFLPTIKHTHRPLISIVVPLYNTPQKYFEQMLHSVVNQTYEKWELILVDGSSKKKISRTLIQYSDWDRRIKYYKLAQNRGIAGNTNFGIKKASGEFIAFLDHDDMLSVHALNELVSALNDNRNLDLIYSDEDKLSENGQRRLNPHFKPDWSPHLLRSVNYITHLLVVRKSLLERIGGLRKGFEGAQDYDLVLRLVDETANIYHVPKILYHWREAKRSTATNFALKKDILEAGTRALNQHLARNHSPGEAKPLVGFPGFYQVSYEQLAPKPWTIVFDFPPDILLSLEHLKSFLSASNLHPDSRIIVPNNLDLKTKFKQIPVTDSFLLTSNDFVSELIKKVDTKYILFVGRYLVFPLDTQWPRTFQGVLGEKNVATVAPRLIDEGGVIKYLGYDTYGSNKTIMLNISSDKSTYFGYTDWVRNTAKQGNIFAITTKLFKELAEPFDFDRTTRKFRPDFFKKAQKRGLFHVVWSEVDYRIYSGMSELSFRELDFFNSNLDIYAGDVVMKSYVKNEDYLKNGRKK